MATDIGKLRGLGAEELEREEHELRDEIWKLRLQRVTGQLQNTHKVRAAKRELARLLTVRREREGGTT
jgi:large subunit ribosomal protein L29